MFTVYSHCMRLRAAASSRSCRVASSARRVSVRTVQPVAMTTVAQRKQNYLETPSKIKMCRGRAKLAVFALCCFSLFSTIAHGAYTDVADQVLEWSDRRSCTKYEYFDTDLFKCTKCASGLVSSGNGLACVCDKNSRIVGFKGNYPICERCAAGKIPTSDGHHCISCRERGPCGCLGNEIRVERSWNGTLLDKLQCLPCPNNTYSSNDGTRCLPCSSSGSNDNGSCPFSEPSHERSHEYCLPRNAPTGWLDVRNTYLVKFKRKTVDSYYFRSELRLAMYSCEKGDRNACEHLGNMCALTLYSDSAPCKPFTGRSDNPTKLFYRESDTSIVLNSRTIAQRYTLDQTDPNSRVKLIVAAFTLRGGLETINELSLSCPFFGNVRFGVNLSKRCKISAIELTNEKMTFLVPYLSYSDKSTGKKFLHALPVLLQTNRQSIEDDFGRRQLVRKFFSVDKITGFKAIPNSRNSSFTRGSELEVLRYIKSLNLFIKVQERNKQGKIFPPLLVVEYGELTKEEIAANVEVSVEYKVTYSLADDEMNSAIEVCIGVFTGLAVAFSAIKAWSHCRRNNENGPSIGTFAWFIVYSFGAVGNALVLVCSTASIYTFIFYKGQKVVHLLLPKDANEFTVRVCTIVAFAFKAVEILGLIYQYRKVNVFFIDWEQPRKIVSTPFKYDSPRTSLRKSYTGRFTIDPANTLQSASEIIAARRNKTPSKSSQGSSSTPSRQSGSRVLDHPEGDYPAVCFETNFSNDEQDLSSMSDSVSIWRTCVVANEWLKIRTKRKINVFLQMLVTLLILEIVGVKYWSMAVPELTIDREEMLSVDESFTLQYAVGILTYAIVYFVQWWLTVFMWERYVKNQLQQFIDLCSMANISAFILSHDYYGYYIHGRSVHGFADTDLLTLINDLKREENNLCAHRGLIAGTTEQTFIISVSKTFRSFYDALLGAQSSGNRKFLRSVSRTPDWDERWRTHLKLRKFLSSFLDHCFKNVDYTVKDRHFLEKLCDVEMADADEKSVFYIDNHYSFDRTLFYGNEWTLATFEVTVFLLVLVLGGSYIFASVVTVFAAKAVNAVATFDGKRILASKTLIDERFLGS